jgi:hypothetical protein
MSDSSSPCCAAALLISDRLASLLWIRSRSNPSLPETVAVQRPGTRADSYLSSH